MKVTESKENLVNSTTSLETGNHTGQHSSYGYDDLEIPEIVLTKTEKKFLLSAERGDCATVRRYVLQGCNKMNSVAILKKSLHHYF